MSVKIVVACQTRGEDGTAVTDLSFSIGGVNVSTLGTATGIYLLVVIHKSLTGSPASTFVVDVFTKNMEDAGSQGSASAIATFSTLGLDFLQAKVTNVKQLVRFKITLTPGTGVTGPDGVCYRFLPPTWYDKAV